MLGIELRNTPVPVPGVAGLSVLNIDPRTAAESYRQRVLAPDISLLLPCNVVVREESGNRVVVGFLDPQVMVTLVGKPEMKAVADAAEQRLRRACESLGGSTKPT